jgi:hypothetical protein
MEITNNTAIHCESQEEFTRIGNFITSTFKMFSDPEYFTRYKSKSCLYIDGGYSNLDWAKKNEYKIIKSTEIPNQ